MVRLNEIFGFRLTEQLTSRCTNELTCGSTISILSLFGRAVEIGGVVSVSSVVDVVVAEPRSPHPAKTVFSCSHNTQHNVTVLLLLV